MTLLSKKNLAIIGMLYCAVILGSHYIVTKNMGIFLDAGVITAYRFLIASIPLLIYVYLLKLNPFVKIKPGLILGFFLFLIFISMAKGVQYTLASNAGFISGAFILFLPVVVYFFTKRKPTIHNLLVIFISLFGLYYLTGGLKNINLGDWLIMLSAFFTAIHITLVGKFAKLNINVFVLCLQQFMTVFFLSLIFLFITGKINLFIPIQQLPSLLFLGLLPTLSVFLIQIIALKYISETTASLLLTFQPIFSTIFAILLGGEHLTNSIIIGGVLIIISNIINQSFVKFNQKEWRIKLRNIYWGIGLILLFFCSAIVAFMGWFFYLFYWIFFKFRLYILKKSNFVS